MHGQQNIKKGLVEAFVCVYLDVMSLWLVVYQQIS